jgi:imidazole glycerol phosphate synthase subunit HisF
MTLTARVIPCLDVKDLSRCPQPQRGEDAQRTKKEAVL